MSASNCADRRAETPKGLIPLPEFCRTRGIGRTKAYELLAKGELKAKSFGNRTLITEESAEAWAASLPDWQPSRPSKRVTAMQGA